MRVHDGERANLEPHLRALGGVGVARALRGLGVAASALSLLLRLGLTFFLFFASGAVLFGAYPHVL